MNQEFETYYIIEVNTGDAKHHVGYLFNEGFITPNMREAMRCDSAKRCESVINDFKNKSKIVYSYTILSVRPDVETVNYTDY